VRLSRTQAAGYPLGAGSLEAEFPAEDQIDGQVVLGDRDGWMLPATVQQGALEHAPGQVLAVQDPAAGMAALAAQIVGGIGLVAGPLEAGAGLQQAVDQARAGLHHAPDDLFTVQAVAGDQGVADVQVEMVQRREDRRDAALGVVGVALLRVLLGDDANLAMRGRQQGELQPRDPRSDDQATTRTQILQVHRSAPRVRGVQPGSGRCRLEFPGP
jgi:hypothetical protein